MSPRNPRRPASAPIIAVPPEVAEELDRAVEEALRKRQVRGAVLVVGVRDRILKRKAYGLRRVGSAGPGPEEPMTLDTIFDLASVTKVAATSTALALLVQDGKAALDDPVSEFLPRWPEEGLTLRHLATHTSGFQAYLNAKTVAKKHPDLPGNEAVITAIAEHKRKYERGRGYTYSCLNYLLLARVVEEIAGEDLESFLRRRLWKPLGMKDTFYRVPPGKIARCAPTEDGLRGTVHDPLARLYGQNGHFPGNAGLFSTADDLARFLGMLSSKGEWKGKRILEPETVEFLFRNHAPPESGIERALGWVIPTDPAYLPRKGIFSVRYHKGFTGTFLWLDRESGVFLVLLTSRLHPVKGNVEPLRRRTASIAARKVAAPRRPAVEAASEAP